MIQVRNESDVPEKWHSKDTDTEYSKCPSFPPPSSIGWYLVSHYEFGIFQGQRKSIWKHYGRSTKFINNKQINKRLGGNRSLSHIGERIVMIEG